MSFAMTPNRVVLVGLYSLFALSLMQGGCSSPDSRGSPPSGPAMGIVEVDPSQIPLGEDDSNGGGSSSGGGSGGPIGTAGTASQPTPGVMLLGKPCESSSDCPAGQSCHMDPDFISHKQCTVSCETEAQCTAIEKDAFCIGAHVCVHA